MMKAKMFFMSLVTLVAALSFTGCSKEDDEFKLTGSTWVCEDNDGNVSVSITIKFTTDVDAIYTARVTDGSYVDSETVRYTYMYEEPYVELYPEEADDAVLRGLINGSVMEVTNKSTNINIGTFTRQ